MANIIDYVEKIGNKDFTELDFNEVDSLIMCSLSYQVFDKYVPNINSRNSKRKSIYLKELLKDEQIVLDMIEPTLLPSVSKKFINALVKTKRFGDIKIAFFDSKFDEITQTQFAAMTFLLPNKINYIAFRGTDMSILGWKEDFNMALLNEIPGQTHAVNYLNYVIPRLKGTIYVGGHSKGGNLARFGSTFTSYRHQKKICKIFDHDGPGIQRDLSNEPRYIKIQERIFKTIPFDSIIGILLNHDGKYKVVKAKYVSLLQHDQYNWKVDLDNADFIYSDKSSLISQINDEAINKWIKNMPDEKKKIVVECIFDIFAKAEIKTIKQMLSYPLTKLYRSINAISNFSNEEKHTLFQTMTSLIKIWFLILNKKIKTNTFKNKKNIE